MKSIGLFRVRLNISGENNLYNDTNRLDFIAKFDKLRVSARALAEKERKSFLKLSRNLCQERFAVGTGGYEDNYIFIRKREERNLYSFS